MIAVNPLYQSAHNYEVGIRVENALLRTDPNRFRRISVIAFHGIVELVGKVGSTYDKSLALDIARRVPGVTTVVESVRILKDSASRGAAAPLGSLHRPLPKAQERTFRDGTDSAAE